MTKPVMAAKKAKSIKPAAKAPVKSAKPPAPKAVEATKVKVVSHVGPSTYRLTPQPIPGDEDVLQVYAALSSLPPIQACSQDGIPWLDAPLVVNATVGDRKYQWVNPESRIQLQEDESLMAVLYLPHRPGMEIGHPISSLTVQRGALGIASARCEGRPLAKLTLEVRVI